MSRRRSTPRRNSITDLFDPLSLTQRYFQQPSLEDCSLADLLDLLGEDDDERVETMMSLLRRSSEEEVQQVMAVVQRAMTSVALERAAGQSADGATASAPQVRRRQSAAEWRSERRRAE